MLEHIGGQGLPFSDRSALLGDGIFESLNVTNRHILNWDKHMERMTSGYSLCQFPGNLEMDYLYRGVCELMEDRENLDGSIRITISRGNESRGYLPGPACSPNVWIQFRPVPKTQDASGESPIRATVSPYPVFSHDPLQKIKSTSRLGYVLSAIHAQNSQCQEALILNQYNQLVEWTSGNLFIYHDDNLFFPDEDAGALPGTTGSVFVELAHQYTWTIHRKNLSMNSIPSGASLLLTNSLRGIQSVSELNGTSYPIPENLHQWNQDLIAISQKTEIQ